MIRINRTYAVAAHDVAMGALSFVIALILRWGPNSFAHESIGFLFEGMIIFSAVCALVFWRTRTYRGFWKYASLRDVINIAWAVSLTILIFLPILFVATRLEAFPRSALFINWFILLALLLGPRLLYRAIIDGSLGGILQRTTINGKIPVILVGADDNAELFIRATSSGAASNYRVVAIIDDDLNKKDQYIRNVKIYGPGSKLAEISKDLKRQSIQPQRLILTSEITEPDRLKELLAAADGLSLPLSRLPKLTDFQNSEKKSIEVKPIAIEDLLGRPQATLDMDSVAKLVKGRKVCITGAGGTIGSELCKQISELFPAKLVLIDNSEYNLYSIDQSLEKINCNIDRKLYLADIRDKKRIKDTFSKEHPDVVFHAAALKHVPMVESNPNEGILTNIIGTRNVADACVEFEVDSMVLISTDKAVNPTNVMGATKRVAESYCQALGETLQVNQNPLKIVTVRFGNVLGSSGSVVPLFHKQISEGGPVTITHKKISRFFMTTREAVQLVLQASANINIAANGGICVLDMGKPIFINDLAHQMIRLAGHIPDVDINIIYTGLRPGEKLYEELFHPDEATTPTSIPGVLLAKIRSNDYSLICSVIEKMESKAIAGQSMEAILLISSLVPEYKITNNSDTPNFYKEPSENLGEK